MKFENRNVEAAYFAGKKDSFKILIKMLELGLKREEMLVLPTVEALSSLKNMLARELMIMESVND